MVYDIDAIIELIAGGTILEAVESAVGKIEMTAQ